MITAFCEVRLAARHVPGRPRAGPGHVAAPLARRPWPRDDARYDRAVIEIAPGIDGSPLPYSNLLPVVEFLVAHGNPTMDGGFVMNPDGWRCRMSKTIDMAALRASFVFPDTISLSEKWDTVHDTNTWIGIEGPGARR
jgi:hypothetical protein